ncbi:MAG: DUF2807 domain-containing protein [Flavisolibacter sp.]|nr:DUF2807 domain-containing protein [Flavisolibacter sp.]
MRILILIISIVLLRNSCHINFIGGKRITGNGSLSTEQRNVGTFTGVDVRGSMDVFLSSGLAHAVRVEADGNLLPYIETTNNGGTLRIGSRNGYNLNPRAGIKIYVTAPELSGILVTGSGDVVSQSRISSRDKLHTEIRGSGDIRLEMDAPQTEAEITGSGSITLNGNTRTLNVAIRGSGDVHGFNLMSENAQVDIAGSGNAQVYASKQLDIDIKGSGNTEYKGNPSINQKVHGSGDIRRVP